MAAVTPQQVQTILNTMKKEADLASVCPLTEIVRFLSTAKAGVFSTVTQCLVSGSTLQRLQLLLCLSQLVAGLSEAQLQAAVASITEPTKRAAAEALDLSNEEQQQKLLAQMSESKRKIITPQGC